MKNKSSITNSFMKNTGNYINYENYFSTSDIHMLSTSADPFSFLPDHIDIEVKKEQPEIIKNEPVKPEEGQNSAKA